MNRRYLLLALLLAGTLAAAFWPGEKPADTVVEPVRKAARPAPARHPESSSAVRTDNTVAEPDGARPAFDPEVTADLFPAQSFMPPPLPPPAAPPAPPMAPSLPFTFLGQWSEGDTTTVFLDQGDSTLLAHSGERLPGGWQLDAITPGAIVFTYVPLNQQRTLRTAP